MSGFFFNFLEVNFWIFKLKSVDFFLKNIKKIFDGKKVFSNLVFFDYGNNARHVLKRHLSCVELRLLKLRFGRSNIYPIVICVFENFVDYGN